MVSMTLAGIGGCPHAPGASGNTSSEDLAFMLAAMGVETGIDLPAFLRLRATVAGWLEGEQTNGAMRRAGLPKTYSPLLPFGRRPRIPAMQPGAVTRACALNDRSRLADSTGQRNGLAEPFSRRLEAKGLS